MIYSKNISHAVAGEDEVLHLGLTGKYFLKSSCLSLTEKIVPGVAVRTRAASVTILFRKGYTQHRITTKA